MHDFAKAIFSDAEPLELSIGSYLFHAGDPIRFVHFIDFGKLTLERVQASGQTACFQRAGAGDVVAEASVYTQAYHCDARALSNARLRRVRTEDFHQFMANDPSLAHAWAAHLARSVQKARLISEIRCLKTVSERLDAWLGAFSDLPLKGQWQSLAHELAVSPEALYREMATRRKALVVTGRP